MHKLCFLCCVIVGLALGGQEPQFDAPYRPEPVERFAGPLVYGLVCNRCAGSPEFMGRPVAADRDSVVPKESCLFHILSWYAVRAKTIRPRLYHLT